MFSFLPGSRRGKSRDERIDESRSPFAQSPETSRNRVVGQSLDDDDDEYEDADLLPPRRRDHASYFDQVHDEDFDDEEEGEEEQDGEDAVETPLLPIFSAAHLDRLPLYNITHAIRLLIVQKCETTLSWDQLRSPQISQFLVKPIQSQIRTNHFNRATLCALIANCLQFQKEGQLRPGNIGVSRTRALISELLAMRLIKEFSTRELIDALSYDFDPLQGMSASNTGTGTPAVGDLQSQRTQARAARVSTIEIAIRAQAKRFLAHPLVVQHLEAIWAGTVVFHAEADSLHRRPQKPQGERRGRRANGYGTIEGHSPSVLPADSVLSRKAHGAALKKKPAPGSQGRRSVTLYDPRDASLFKLSRLRVPRYRQVLNTLSLAIMLGLFLAVLVDRSLYITPLEVVFWIWSAGYMLDEIVGFTEQGFGLYILSFWNAFDLGILLLFVIYYCLRLYGIVLAEQGKHRIAGMAYDVLATTSVLLFPRLFGVLDHYRYFSQLLIAFRMMAQDLIAILVLIMIFCSGFFAAFTLSFSDEETDANAVAYALFQILMGFTPAAWDKWSGYNVLGKAVMTGFLIICHFMIVTILITVLTNSFMAIVKNAEEEHQFLFAVNTISMVKSDALFSYVAPTNVIGWVLSPLRYVMPFRQYVKFNRTIIKVTHFPVLFLIFAYERVILSMMAYEPTDLVEKPANSQPKPFAFSMNKVPEVFSPGRRLREPSVIGVRKDLALDEVFRRPYRGSTVRTTTRDMDAERRNSATAVDKWMQAAENEGGASPPVEQPRSVLDRLETRRPKVKRSATAERSGLQPGRQFSTASKSAASDPDLMSFADSRRPPRIDEESELVNAADETGAQDTEADGDDENNGDSDDAVTPGLGESALSVVDRKAQTTGEESDDEYFQTPMAGKSPLLQMSTGARARSQDSPDQLQASNPPYAVRALRHPHNRNASSGTILFAPQQGGADDSSSAPPVRHSKPNTAKTSGGGTATPSRPDPPAPGPPSRPPKPRPHAPAKPRPIMPPRQSTAPSGFAGLSYMPSARARAPREPSFNARALDLASEIGDNKFGPAGGMMMMGDGAAGVGVPASFSEQMLRERQWEEEERRRRRTAAEEEEKGRVSRIMLARMQTLEEGFREVRREIREMGSGKGGSEGVSTAGRGGSEGEEVGVGVKGKGVGRVRGGQAAGAMRGRREGEGGMPPKTPVGRIGGNEGRGKRSPRKLQQQQQQQQGQLRREAKEKDGEGRRLPGGSGRDAENAVPRPASVVGPAVVAGAETETETRAEERPGTAGTAILSPAPDEERKFGE